MIYKFTSDKEGQVLAPFIKQSLRDKFSQKGIKKAIEKGACRVNKRVVSYANHKLKKGDVIEIALVETEVKKSLDIVYEDDDIVIIDKPQGVASEEKSLNPFFSYPIHLVHRLDKETSGLLILVKNSQIKKTFEDLFRSRQITKRYLAICDGLLPEAHGIIEVPLEETHSGHHAITVKVNQFGEDMSKTIWKKIAEGTNASLLEFEIISGKTHQIRVHAKHIGHAVLGDPVYLKKPKCTFIPSALCLHAFFLQFTHPITNKLVKVAEAPPDNFKKTLKTLIPDAKLPRY